MYEKIFLVSTEIAEDGLGRVAGKPIQNPDIARGVDAFTGHQCHSSAPGSRANLLPPFDLGVACESRVKRQGVE